MEASKGKHIKHSPNVIHRLLTERETLFLVKSKTPYISAIKKIDKILVKYSGKSTNKKYQGGQYKKVKFITIKGMGKSIQKTVSIGLKYQQDGDYPVDVFTGSVQVLDELKPEDSDEENSTYKTRMVSFVEIRIHLRQ